MTREEVINEIEQYILKNGGDYPDWYIGITSDPNDRLFNGHRVEKDRIPWIYRLCSSSDVARIIEDYFLGERGTMGGPGGGDDDATYVYAYKISDGTVENRVV